MASGALPPGFPAVEIDGEYYWDGGLVSNTPLTEVDLEKDHPIIREAQKVADGRAVNVLQLIFKNKAYQGHYKDYEFSIDTMRDHWQTGLDDIRASFEHPDWFAIPSHDSRFITHDVHYARSPAEKTRITGAIHPVDSPPMCHPI